MYITCDEMKQLIRELKKRLAAKDRFCERRPEPMVRIPVTVPVKPLDDGDYG